MKLIRNITLLAGLVLVLVMVNLAIRDKEDVLANGRLVLLELRPVDPRSLIQGDYMVLRYVNAAFPETQAIADMPLRGTVVMKLDEQGIAGFSRQHTGAELGDGEFLLRYKLRTFGDGLRYGAESFFFEEGDAELYAQARYGMLRVDDEGESILVGVADGERRMIVKPED